MNLSMKRSQRWICASVGAGVAIQCNPYSADTLNSEQEKCPDYRGVRILEGLQYCMVDQNAQLQEPSWKLCSMTH